MPPPDLQSKWPSGEIPSSDYRAYRSSGSSQMPRDRQMKSNPANNNKSTSSFEPKPHRKHMAQRERDNRSCSLSLPIPPSTTTRPSGQALCFVTPNDASRPEWGTYIPLDPPAWPPSPSSRVTSASGVEEQFLNIAGIEAEAVTRDLGSMLVISRQGNANDTNKKERLNDENNVATNIPIALASRRVRPQTSSIVARRMIFKDLGIREPRTVNTEDKQINDVTKKKCVVIASEVQEDTLPGYQSLRE